MVDKWGERGYTDLALELAGDRETLDTAIAGAEWRGEIMFKGLPQNWLQSACLYRRSERLVRQRGCFADHRLQRRSCLCCTDDQE